MTIEEDEGVDFGVEGGVPWGVPGGVEGGVEGGVVGGVLGGVLGGALANESPFFVSGKKVPQADRAGQAGVSRGGLRQPPAGEW